MSEPAVNQGLPMQIATWNVNSIRVRLPQVLEWLEDQRPDVLGIQEIKLVNEDFPAEELADAGYRSVVNGQKTYNGVALLSREPCQNVLTDLPGMDDPQRRFLAATINGIRVVNLYVPNGQAVGSDKFAYKLAWLEALRDWLAGEVKRFPRMVVMGDFNIAPEDSDVHDPAAWQGSVHVSSQERDALQAIFALGLVDAFRLFEQPGAAFSWWDYRGGAFRRNHGLRIDLVLVSPQMAEACLGCHTDIEPRRWDRPSDHAPVLAHFR